MDINKIKKEIGLKIKTFRRKSRLTQEQFSEIINLEQASLSNIENGKTYPTFSTVCNLIEKANIEPNYLFDFLYINTNQPNELDEIVTLLKNLSPEYKKHIIEIIKPVVKLS